MAPPSTVTASATQSLYSSILAPPPTKRARTIHNPEDPPIVAPPKPKPASPRKSRKQTRGSPSSSKDKSRKGAKGKGKDTSQRSSGRGLTPRNSFSEDTNNDDMKAAATLTSLLRGRPSLSASSPRSSLSAGSDAGSLHSFAHYAQSSARTTTVPIPGAVSAEPTLTPHYTRSSTPPPLSKRTQSLTQPSDMRFHSHTRSLPNARSTPKAQSQPSIGMNHRVHPGIQSPHNPPTDTEAADLMLFLATSPSPVRPTTVKERDERDMAAFRSLSGNPALQGRVLFPGSSPAESASHTFRGKPLQRDGSGFSSTLSIATDASGETVYAGGSGQEKLIGVPISATTSLTATSSTSKPTASSANHSRHTTLGVPQLPTVTPPTPTDQTLNHLLPTVPPQSPARQSSHTTNVSGAHRQEVSSSSLSGSQHPMYPGAHAASASSSSSSVSPPSSQPNPPSGSQSLIPTAPPTPSNSAAFNFHDFLNVSPSPAAATPQKLGNSGNLRADVGRRLFEEHHAALSAVMGGMGNSSHGQSGSGNGLGAGIDLVKS